MFKQHSSCSKYNDFTALLITGAVKFASQLKKAINKNLGQGWGKQINSI